ncbi:uncharacterized protein ARMOST_14198 [Armillaria ostoyae]|uniref:Uncharacterized protein n=1 Tax=Armillaria ostoyae TaxID=47428 RepID=A0A284RPX5_ARMOS|nr:uncharacterized protein ARMOST_14198 [Armillaria ostoyae]
MDNCVGMGVVKRIDRKGDGPVVEQHRKGVKACDIVYFPSEEKLENAIYAEGASPRSTGCRQGRELTSRADAGVCPPTLKPPSYASGAPGPSCDPSIDSDSYTENRHRCTT